MPSASCVSAVRGHGEQLEWLLTSQLHNQRVYIDWGQTEECWDLAGLDSVFPVAPKALPPPGSLP